MPSEIVDRIKEILVNQKIDAVLVGSPDNVTYTAGFEVPSQIVPISRDRLVFCVVTASGESLMLVPDMEYTLAESNAHVDRVRDYNEFTQDPLHVLSDSLNELGAAQGIIAVEDDFIPEVHLAKLRAHIPNAKLTAAKPIMSDARSVKTAEELTTITRVGKLAERAHYDAARETNTGMSEKDIATHLYRSIFSSGAQRVNHLVVGSGERSGLWNANPTDRILRKGDVIRVDVFAKIDGYQSDVARTWVAGKPSAQDREVWSKLIDARSMLFEQIKPGADTTSIFQSYENFFNKVELDPVNFVGHGLGITLHEPPYISRYHDDVLVPGMVLAIEPMTIYEGVGYQVEDEIIVTETGYTLITDHVEVPDLIEVGGG
jgi:Xaa-Pro aminopeptidase